MLDSMMKISLTLVAIDKMSRVIRDAVNKSNQEFQKMQNEIKQTSQTLNELGQNIAKTGGIITAAVVGIAHQLGMTEAVNEAFQLEHQLRELGNVGQLTSGQLADMDKRLGTLSKNTNQYRSEIAEGLNVLVASGVAPEKALEYMQVIGKTATAAGAEISDISKTAFALTDNLKVPVSELNRTMDILNSTAHNVKFGFQIAQAGDKMGLASAFSVKNGVFADIRRIDNNLRNGLIKGFKELPSNIAKSSVALTLRMSQSVIGFTSTASLMLRRQVAKFQATLSTSSFVKDWTVTSIKAIPTNFMAGLQGLKTGFLSIPRLIKTAIISFRAFSLTLLTSPLGWIALAIAGVSHV